MSIKSLKTEELIALTMIPGMGPVMQRKLIQHFGDFSDIVKAGSRKLSRLTGLESTRFDILKDEQWRRLSDAELKFCEKHQVRAIPIWDHTYPALLAGCHDAPLIIYCLGSMEFNAQPAISIVGTREASEYGKKMAHRISSDLSRAGCSIISGLARGIDLCAHQASMEAGGRTVAVLGHGLRLIYPASHRPVAASIVESGGCLITEFIHTTPFNPGNFPSRNRIIAGLSLATVVVEARKTGGALITAQLADGYQRDVFAVPGPADSVLSEGCHDLIRNQLARLATRASDILDIVCQGMPEQLSLIDNEGPVEPDPEIRPDEAELLMHLPEAGIHIDILLDKTQLPAADLLARLMFMEMKGIIEALPGKYYRRRSGKARPECRKP